MPANDVACFCILDELAQNDQDVFTDFDCNEFDFNYWQTLDSACSDSMYAVTGSHIEEAWKYNQEVEDEERKNCRCSFQGTCKQSCQVGNENSCVANLYWLIFMFAQQIPVKGLQRYTGIQSSLHDVGISYTSKCSTFVYTMTLVRWFC